LLLVIGAVLIAATPVRAAGQLFFPWDTPPTAFTSFYVRYAKPPGCEEVCQQVQVQGILSGFTGGQFGFDADGDGDRDGTLTADFQMVSEVIPTLDGQFQYTWTLTNRGTGPAIAFLGSGPNFAISRTNPLAGTISQSFVSPAQPILSNFGIIINPNTGLSASLYAPASNPPQLEVTIDIKPGDPVPKPINPSAKGNVPVAILSTSTFDATTVDPSTVRFGPSGVEATAVLSSVRDVDGDGRLDLLVYFNNTATQIGCGESTGLITGQTFSGQHVQGFQPINTSGC
jgi:hypothetical protein